MMRQLQFFQSSTSWLNSIILELSDNLCAIYQKFNHPVQYGSIGNVCLHSDVTKLLRLTLLTARNVSYMYERTVELIETPEKKLPNDETVVVFLVISLIFFNFIQPTESAIFRLQPPRKIKGIEHLNPINMSIYVQLRHRKGQRKSAIPIFFTSVL